MYKSDKIKAIVAFILFSVIAYFYFTQGKTQTTKIVVGVCGVTWLITMLTVKKEK